MADLEMKDAENTPTSIENQTPQNEEQQQSQSEVRERLVIVLGIDFGTEKSVISICQWKVPNDSNTNISPVLLNNNFSNQTTPNIVSFKGNERFIGEEAASLVITSPDSTIYSVKAVVDGQEGSLVDDDKIIYRPRYDKSTQSFEINYESVSSVTPTQVISMILTKLKSFSLKFIQQHYSQHYEILSENPLPCVISVPYWWNEQQQQQILDACTISSLKVVTLCSQLSAASLFHGFNQRSQLPTFNEPKENPSTTNEEGEQPPIENEIQPKPENKGRLAVFIDHGHFCLEAQLVQLFSDRVIVHKGIVDVQLGGHVLDSILFEHFEQEMKKMFGTIEYRRDGNKNKEKKGIGKLEKAVKKVKHTLSTISDTQLELALDERDVTIKISKSKYLELISSFLQRIPISLEKLFNDTGFNKSEVEEIEVIGGNVRSPDISKVISDFFGGMQLSRNLDGNSAVSFGSSLLGGLIMGKNEETLISSINNYQLIDHTFKQYNPHTLEKSDIIEKYLEVEKHMRENDEKIEKRQQLRSNLESYIYDFKDKVNDSSIFSLPEEKEKALKKLSLAEDWLYDQHDEVDFQVLEDYFTSLKSEMENGCPGAFGKMKELEEQRRKEVEEAERLAKLNAQESSKQPRTDKQRMQYAEKKKQQGTVAFKEFDYPTATSCFATAVGYLEEMYEQTEESKTLKISLYSNLALCFLKLEKYSRVIDNCKKVHELDNKNIKSIFRHGQALTKLKDWEQAEKQFNLCLSIDPNNAESKKELANIQKEIEKQKQKEKKMYSAMFA